MPQLLAMAHRPITPSIAPGATRQRLPVMQPGSAPGPFRVLHSTRVPAQLSLFARPPGGR